MRLITDRVDHFDFGAAEFWRRISEVDEYRAWWPWLREFDGHRLEPGDRWTCAVHPPVPYVVHFALSLDAVDPGRSISATITGDIAGTANLSVTDDGSGCNVRLVSELSPAKQSLRVMSIAARPIVSFGHSWILDIGVREFRSRSKPDRTREQT
ncbi:MAG: polyketide cyclase [Ilumatobacteraceae bacterium]|nr:polyketide cyclase [Ilumatobacteraceae bacterium]